MHVELHDMLFQMNQIACWVTCMLSNMQFSMLVNMHVSEHDMLFSDDPTLNLQLGKRFGEYYWKTSRYLAFSINQYNFWKMGYLPTEVKVIHKGTLHKIIEMHNHK